MIQGYRKTITFYISFYFLFFSTFVINKYRRFFGRSKKFFYPNYTSMEYLRMGSNATRFKNKFEKGKREKKEKKKWKKNRRNVPVNYLSGVYRVRYWNKCSTRRWIGVLWMGARVSLTIIVLCPFVYTHREFRHTLRCNVSHVSINERVYRFVVPFFS